IIGCCIKPKIRSAKDQHEINPTSTPRTEKMIRFLNSSRWASNGMDLVCNNNTAAATSAMEDLQCPAIVSKTTVVDYVVACLNPRCFPQQGCRRSLLSLTDVPPKPSGSRHSHDKRRIISMCVVD